MRHDDAGKRRQVAKTREQLEQSSPDVVSRA